LAFSYWFNKPWFLTEGKLAAVLIIPSSWGSQLGGHLHQYRIAIKDQKVVSSDKFGIAPFDASRSLTKLMSWDSPPTEAEVEDIKPLLTRIQSLKSAAGGGLIGMQLMAFFLQRCIQPLQSRVSKLWSYSGSADPS
jgi:hypothetical protein